ncbi:MAG TPA: hypothetical protein VF556_04985 [Pyrinomonadaceae bacterium]
MNYYNYFSEIEETFVRRRGRNLLLSPLDWALIETWQQRNVPLHIVLRAIEKVFDGVDEQPSRRRSVKSLMYCREEIEAQYAEWLERQAGKSEAKISSNGEGDNGVFSRESVLEHLKNSIIAINKFKEKTRSGDFTNVIRRLEELKIALSDDYEKTEEILIEIENFLNDELKRSADAAHLTAVKKDAEKQLSGYKNKMEKEVYEQTFDLIVVKRLREDAEIPRLSLYSL